MRYALCLVLVGLLSGSSLLAQDEAKPDPKKKPVVEIAILLDTSGSMSGLINQARSHLWTIVNKLATARRDGQLPNLRVALYEYGKSSLPANTGFMRQIVPLTDDLDKISKELFALTTNGGEEYCGQVIQQAVAELMWDKGDHYRAIFIAGNEAFTQGSVDYKVSCAAAVQKGIVVNTIHCGQEQEGINGKWVDGASISDGQSINIDHNVHTVAIPTPFDKTLATLNTTLNDTYIGYGKEGKGRIQLQSEMDEAAKDSEGGMAPRAASKANSHFYRNSSWDLVDAIGEKTLKLEDLKDEDLPEEMKKMDLEERKAHVEKKSRERKKVQGEMKDIAAKRNLFIVEKRKTMAEDGKDTFQSAIQKMLETQLTKKNYTFPKEKMEK